MAIDYNTLSDFNLDNFTGVIPDASGAVVLEPNNYVPDQFLRTLGPDGSPAGWSKVEGPTSDGYHAYLFLISGDVRTGGKQTFTPDKPEVATHLFNKPLVSGGLAPTASTPGVTVPSEPLEAATVTKVASGVSGFQQGEYLAAISLMSPGGDHTMTTNPVQVTVNTDNKLIEFKLLLDADRTQVANQGLWLSEPVALGQTPSASTLRLQDIASNTGRTHVVNGPYDYSGRLAPTENETMIGSPPQMALQQDFWFVGGQVKTSPPGRYVFYQVQVTALGESLASPGSAPVEKKRSVQQGATFNPALDPDAVGYKIFWQDFYEGTAPAMYQLVRTAGGDRTRYFEPDEWPMCFFNVDEGGGEIARDPGPYFGQWRAFTASNLTNLLTLSSGRFSNGDEVRLKGGNLPSGLKADRSYWVRDASGSSFKLATTKAGRALDIGGGSGQIATYEYVKPPESFETVSIQADPPTEDASGIANPTGDIDPPLAVGLGIPEAGTYIVGYTRVLSGRETSGRETPLSDTVQITLEEADVAAGMVIKMDYPPRINKIPNALFGQVDQAGLPLNWTTRNSSDVVVTAPDSNHKLDQAGVWGVTTSGSLANAGRYPNVQTASGYEIALDPSRVETVAGWLGVSGYTSGTAYIEVVQLDGALAEVGTPLTLATLTANGAIEFSKTIAATGLGADLTLHASAAYARIRYGAQGNPRQMRVKAYSQIWSPQRGAPRRYIAPASPSSPWVATTDPAAPWPSTHVLAIGQPPPTAASAVALPSEETGYQADLIELITFENQAWPAGWTVEQDPTNANTDADILAAAAIEGSYGFRTRDQDTSAIADVWSYKVFPVATHGADLAFRFICRINSLPTPNLCLIGGWQGDSGAATGYVLPSLYLYYTGRVVPMYSSGGSYGEIWNGIGQIAYAGAVLDCEIICKGLGTANGRAEFWIGVDGAPRTLRYSLDFLNWSDTQYLTPAAYVGTWTSNQAASNTYIVDYDSIAVTKSTYQGQVTIHNEAPALTPLVQPDFPWLDGTVLNGPSSSPVDYTHTTSNRAVLGVAATFNRTGAVAAERTLAQIRTSGGTEVVGLYMKTDHTVELRRGATPYAVAAAVPTGTNYRFDVIVVGAGTTNGSAFVYRTIGTGARELITLAQSLDLSSVQAQRVTVANNSELTETNIIVTASGEFTFDNTGADGQPLNQGYVAILAADVVNEDVGFVVEEFIVQPATERTIAVYMKPEDLPDNAAPFTVVGYDAAGRAFELGSPYRDGTEVPNDNPEWAEYWMTYTPPDGYSRIRIEHRNMTAGRYVFQKPLDAVGNLDTQSERDAARDDGRAVEGQYFVILNARVPGQSGTMTGGDYREERTEMVAEAIAPEDEVGVTYTVTANASTDVLTLSGNHRYITDSRVRLLTTDTLPAPLAEDTTYYVRDATTDTLKLAATEGGAAINITDAGTGTHTIFGYTSVASRWRSADSEEALSGLPWQSDPADVPDLEWVEAEITLEGDGVKTPVMIQGSPRVVYQPWMPMLLKGDGTAFYGGVYIGGGGQENNLFEPYSRSLYDTETVGDRAAPRSLTDPVGRLHGFTLNVFTSEALSYIYSDAFLDDTHIITSPFFDLTMRVRFYEPPDEPAAMFDYEGFDEARPFAVSQRMPMVVSVERAEVLEVAPFGGEAPGEFAEGES